MTTGEFDTSDASLTPIEHLRSALDQADRVNGSIIRICCALYTMAREAGVDHRLPVMQQAKELLKYHQFWDAEKWGADK
jgi:hypothetical protein